MAEHAALAIVVCGDTRRLDHHDLLLNDCSAAVENILLAAHGLGLGAVWCGIVNELVNFFRQQLSLPEEVLPVALVAVGHPAEERPVRNATIPAMSILRLTSPKIDASRYRHESKKPGKERQKCRSFPGFHITTNTSAVTSSLMPVAAASLRLFRNPLRQGVGVSSSSQLATKSTSHSVPEATTHRKPERPHPPAVSSRSVTANSTEGMIPTGHGRRFNQLRPPAPAHNGTCGAGLRNSAFPLNKSIQAISIVARGFVAGFCNQRRVHCLKHTVKPDPRL